MVQQGGGRQHTDEFPACPDQITNPALSIFLPARLSVRRACCPAFTLPLRESKQSDILRSDIKCSWRLERLILSIRVVSDVPEVSPRWNYICLNPQSALTHPGPEFLHFSNTDMCENLLLQNNSLWLLVSQWFSNLENLAVHDTVPASRKKKIKKCDFGRRVMIWW